MSNFYIKEINMISFGQFQNKIIKFKDGFNLIYGENESGKSTILDFIEGVFYGFDQGKNKVSFSYKRQKYRPKGSFRYLGYLILCKNGKDYRIDRNFDDGNFEIFDFKENKILDLKKSRLNLPGEYFLNMNYSLYQNIINNQQLQNVDKDSKNKIIEFLKNPSSDLEFSSLKAIENIRDRVNKLGSLRAYTKPLAKNIKILERKKESLAKINKLAKEYDKDLLKLKEERDKIKFLQDKLSSLKDERDEYRKSRANDNYIEEMARKDFLNVIERKLKDYSEFDGIDRVYFKKLDLLFDESKNFYKTLENNKKSPINILLIIGIFIFIGSLFFKKPILLGFLTFPIFFYFMIKYRKDYSSREKISSINIKINNELMKIGAKNKIQYEHKKSKFYEYEKLLVEKDKTIEILKILNKQEKYEHTLEFHNKNLDISKIELDIKNYEKELLHLQDINLSMEKKLSLVEDEIKNKSDLIEDIRIIENKVEDIKIFIRAANKAIDIIESNDDKLSYNKKIIEDKISNIIRHISKGKYKKISYDDNLNPLIETSSKEFIDLDKLSVGFFDQINFALRFSLTYKLRDNFFMIFDDAFINYDSHRLRMALLYLLDKACNIQIIYLTCHLREESLLKAEGIDIKMKYVEQI